jgi:hypothetical protein
MSNDEHTGKPMVTFVDENGMLHSFPVVSNSQMTMGEAIAALGEKGQALQWMLDQDMSVLSFLPKHLHESAQAGEMLISDVGNILQPQPSPADIQRDYEGATSSQCQCPHCGQPITLVRGTSEGVTDASN